MPPARRRIPEACVRGLEAIDEAKHIRPVHDALLALEDEEVVDGGAGHPPSDRAEDRAPEPVLRAVVPDVGPVADHVRHEAGPEVARGVDRVRGLRAEARAEREDGEEDNERVQPRGRRAVPLVGDGADDKHEDGGAQKFVEEAGDVRKVVQLPQRISICGDGRRRLTYSDGEEQRCSGGRTHHGTNVGSTLEE
jgi:hypothetical protein